MPNEYARLKTKYEEGMDRMHPWQEYPRPSLVRESYINLNGEWDFCISEQAPTVYTDSILVPFCPECELSGYKKEINENTPLHYRRIFTLPENFKKDRVILHFGAVDTIAEVMVNGKAVGTHEGGYLPFSYDITDALVYGENELYVKVTDNLDVRYPYGKQTKKRGGMWYTPVSGIWQTVWLESVCENYIKKIKITTDMRSAKITVTGGNEKKRLTLDDDGEVIEFTGDTVTVVPKNIQLWSPEDPYLYYFTLECGEDKIESYFALREVGIGEFNGIKRLTLNGEPYLFNGLLDQGYFPDGLFLPATVKGYEDDILTAKRLGYNMLRKHIKVEPEIFYNLCDSLGIVVFQDMVNNSSYSFFFDTALPSAGLKSLPDKLRHRNKDSRRIFKQSMIKTIDHLYNFPSILYYTVFNEGWGQFCADEMYGVAKECDGTRIIDATSGWFVRKLSDVDSRHVYFKPIKIKKPPKRPIVISEFGGYSHRVTGHLFGKGNYGYSTYSDRAAFEDAFIRLYEGEVSPLIAKGVSALVYTQISDVEDETNGLLTYDRAVLKVSVDRTKATMQGLYNNFKEETKAK
ncbi:MAG: glycoside hydrolase family 2 [Clostridia bacterium]|nr:glycoside hydrolase family 2 [Clostridia bacterium]